MKCTFKKGNPRFIRLYINHVVENSWIKFLSYSRPSSVHEYTMSCSKCVYVYFKLEGKINVGINVIAYIVIQSVYKILQLVSTCMD